MPRRYRTALLLCAPLLAARAPLRVQVADFEGRPVFSEGADLGYYLWKDGDTWRLRWTTKGVMRHFAGTRSRLCASSSKSTADSSPTWSSSGATTRRQAVSLSS